jgi:serine/threonine protein kinase
MSPQQVKDQTLDHQTDIYSLGVVMYQLLTGQLAFSGAQQLRPDLPDHQHRAAPAFGATQRHSGSARRHRRAGDEQETRATATPLGRSSPTIWRRLSPRPKLEGVPAEQMADVEKFDTLRAFAFFADFSDVEIWEVVRFSQWSRVSPGDGDHSRRQRRRLFLFPRRRRTEGAQERHDPGSADHRRVLRRDGRDRQANSNVAPTSSP